MKRITFILTALLMSSALIAQDILEVDMELTYKRQRDGSLLISAYLEDDDGERVTRVPVQFFTVAAGEEDEQVKSLGEIMSDEEGIAKLTNVTLSDFLLDSAHRFTIRAEFEGNDVHDFAEAENTWQELQMELQLTEEEGEKTVGIQLHTWDDSGELVPVEDGEVYLYVPRLFSLLPVGDVWTGPDGYDESDFPGDLPGDKEGNLTVVAKMEESDEFGSYEMAEEINWGLVASGEDALPRALWSSRPPLWMVITFVVLMGGVWIHYILVVFNLLSIRKSDPEGKEINFEV